ncbi:MAG: hypothetical protein N2606_05860 [Candidatus Omnitrophica bacterium]|nr:hypothetical protein [Candidatus Omnitrophota bacterium]
MRFKKVFWVIGFLILVIQTLVFATEQAVDKKLILDKMQEAIRTVNFQRSVVVQELAMQGLFNIKTEQIQETDIPNRIMHTVVQIKDYNFDTKTMMQLARQTALKQGSAQGLSEEQLKKIEDDPTVSVVMEKQFSLMAEKLKGKKTEQYMVGSNLYMVIDNSWYRINQPSFEVMWQLLEKLRKGTVEDREAFLKTMPQELQQALGPLFSLIQSEEFSSGAFMGQIQEKDWQGKAVYEIEVNNPDFKKLLEQTIKDYASQQSGQVLQITVNSFQARNYIDKNSFLPLGSTASIEVTLQMQGISEPIKATLIAHQTEEYPNQKITLPKEVQDATLVQDEKQLQELFQKAIEKDFAL